MVTCQRSEKSGTLDSPRTMVPAPGWKQLFPRAAPVDRALKLDGLHGAGRSLWKFPWNVVSREAGQHSEINKSGRKLDFPRRV